MPVFFTSTVFIENKNILLKIDIEDFNESSLVELQISSQALNIIFL